MKTFSIMIPCTDKKSIQPSDLLRARNLAPAGVDDLAKVWVNNVESDYNKKISESVYNGRSFSEALKAKEILNANFYIISAGLGLISSDHLIPAYNLTVSRGSPDCVLSKISCNQHGPSEWWKALQRHKKNSLSISECFNCSNSDVILLVLSANYAQLIYSELVKLKSEAIKKIRIFGFNIERYLPNCLQENVLPYDLRFNGPDSPLRGTQSDFGSRCLHHFSQCLSKGKIGGTLLSDDKLKVQSIITGWRYPNKTINEKKSDVEIGEFILINWTVTMGRKSKMLKLLRSSGFACEQSRFKHLFDGVAKNRKTQMRLDL